MPTAAAVWVDVLPSMKGFGSSLNKQVTAAGSVAGQEMSKATSGSFEAGLSGTGSRGGQKVTRELGKSVSSGSRGALSGLNSAFNNTFAWAEGLATGTGGRISTAFGRAFTSVLGPIGRFRDGFTNAAAAASQFSGVAGTVGGHVRRAFDGALAPIGAFRAGFSGASAAASGFAGVAQGAGRLVGNVWRGAVGAVDAFRGGFSGAASAATGFAGLAYSAGGRVRSAWNLARAPVAGFRLGFNDASGAAGAFSSTATGIGGRVGNVFQRVGGVIGRFRDGFTNSGAAASAFGGAASTAGGVARRAFDGVRGAVARMGENTRTAAAQAGQALQSGMLAPLGKMARFTGIAAVGTAIVGIGMAGARTAIGIQKSQAALTGLYGSGEMANDMLARLRGLASGSPIEYTAFARGAESLAYMGYSGDQAYNVLGRINTALVASGRGAEAMDQVNYAMLEMVNTGKVYAQQLTQMSQAGLPVWSMLADYMHTTIADVRDQVTQGKVSIDTVMQAIEAGGGETFKRMEAAAEQSSQTLSAVWARTKDNVALAFADMIQPMMGGASGALAAAGNAITGAFQALPGILSAVGTFLAPLWQGFAGVAGLLGGALLGALHGVTTVLGAVFGPVINAVTGFLSQNRIVLYALGGVLGLVGTMLAINAARMIAYSGVMLAVRIATTAWSVAQWLLNAAMLNNPIGWIMMAIVALVAAVVYAYQNFDWFRTIVQACWAGIQIAAQWAWGVLQPIFAGIGSAVQAVGSFFSWLWTAAVVPAWNGIVAAISAAWGFVSPILDGIGIGLRILGAVVFTALAIPFQIAWNLIVAAVQGGWAIIQGVWNIMAAVASWLWNAALAPVFNLIGAAWNALMAGMAFVWNSILRPAWDAIAAAASWLWNTVLSVIFAVIGAQWNLLLTGMAFVWNSILKPTWDALAAAANWLWTTVLLPVFTFIGTAWNALLTGMKLYWDTILKPAWDAIGVAIGWLWNTIMRPVFDAIGAAWHALMVGIDAVWQAVLRPAFDAIGIAVHGVGQAFENVVNWIRGVWGQIGDIAKVPINFVIDVVYNKGIVALWNGIAGVFGLGKLEPMPLLASGGTVPAGPMMTNQPTAVVGEGNPAHPEYVIPTDPKYRGRASGLWASAANDLGMPGFASGGVLGSAWDAVKNIAGSVVGSIGDATSWVTGIVGDIAGGVKSLFGSVFSASDQTPGTGSWTDALKAIPGKVVEAIIGKITSWWDERQTATAGTPGTGGAAPAGVLGDWIRQALALTGTPGNWAGPLFTLIMRESGGNPNIVNTWDSNAAAGHPSGGLMQTIGPTFAAYRDPRLPNNMFDPIANIVAGINYINARYGGIFNVQQAVGSSPKGYDSGGWLMPGETMALNRTRRPEPVLTAEQWDTVARIADSGGQRSVTVNAKTDASPEHIAQTVDRHIAMAGRR